MENFVPQKCIFIIVVADLPHLRLFAADQGIVQAATLGPPSITRKFRRTRTGQLGSSGIEVPQRSRRARLAQRDRWRGLESFVAEL